MSSDLISDFEKQITVAKKRLTDVQILLDIATAAKEPLTALELQQKSLVKRITRFEDAIKTVMAKQKK